MYRYPFFYYKMVRFRIITLNVRGLKNARKRQMVYEFLLFYNFDVCLLQEVHLKDEKDVVIFSEQWRGGESAWSIGGVYGTGVGVLCGNKSIKIKESYTVIQGRVMVVDVEKNGVQSRIINVYAHVDPKQRRELLLSMDTCFITRKNIIVGGDFNVSLEKEKFSLPLKTFIRQYGLTDVMGRLLGKKVGYTWRNTRGVQSRLDYILIDKKCKIKGGKTIPVLLTDHQAVEVDLEIEGMEYGKGYWKLNNEVLKEKDYRDKFLEIFPLWVKVKELYGKKGDWWEDVKCKIKKFTIEYCTDRSKRRKEEFNMLQKEIEHIYVIQKEGKEKNVDLKIEDLKVRQEELLERKARAETYKLKQKEYEEDERCSAYFFKKMKSRDKRGVIEKLEKDGKEIIGRESMLGVVKEYYEDLFRKEKVGTEKRDVLLGSLKRRLVEEDREFLEREITMEEAYKVVKGMKVNRVPGIDGLTKEFYEVFWGVIGLHLLEVFKEILEGEEMAESMRTGVISLLFKKGNPHLLDNYRPLTMLCVDYKILSKIIANRLVGVMSDIVGSDQTCGVKGRQISWNIQLHRDILAYVKDRKMAAICVSLDQQKAFDRLDYEILWEVMTKMGLGKQFIRWVRILYKEIYSKIKLNGFLTEKVHQARGLRQGCPLSVVLYVLYVEPLACAIRENKRVSGIMMPGGECLKISQYADDTILYLADDDSLREVVEILKIYEEVTGSKINKEKTKYKYLGTWEGRRENICDYTLCEGPMDILGISFGNKEGDAIWNWKGKMAEVERKLRLWKMRKLTITGKVLVIKSEVVPKLLYLGYVFPMPQVFRAQIMRGIFNFIWGGYEYVKRVQMYQEVADGGKGVPNIPLKLDTIFYANVCTLLKKPYIHKCQILLWFWLAIPYRFLIGWENQGPKAETRPEYFQRMVKWGKRHIECREVDTIQNHKLLYKKLVRNANYNQGIVSSEVWEYAQDKSYKNVLKDFNWMHLHRKLPVRTTMYAHNLGKLKECPRDNCTEEETIEHVLWGCKYAKKVWAGMKRRYKGLEALTYEEITYLRPKDKKKEENKIRCMLLSITKLKIWRARQGYIKGGYEWKEMGTIKDIEREFEGIYRHELQRWGIDTIKDRWKDYYE